MIRASQQRQVGKLFSRLRALHLPAGDYVVFGSGPLVVRGIIEASGDLDVVCRKAAWDAVCALAPPKKVAPWSVELVSFDQDRLTFGRSWAIGEVDPDLLIDTAEIIDGLPFAQLEHVLGYKKLSRRPKDLAHLEAYRAWLSGGPDLSVP